MKHAVLITAHRSPELLVELIEAMAVPRAHVFVHVDVDAAFGPGDLELGGDTSDRVTFAEPRQRVHWGGYSYLAVILSLLREARTAGPFDFYHLLSGQCYPTMTPDAIFDGFEEEPDRDHLECFPLPTDRWVGGGLNRLRYRHFHDRLDARARVLGLPVNKGIIIGAVAIQRLLRLRRDLPDGIDRFYGGSVFWSLSRRGVDEILNRLEAEPDLELRFVDTYCPEEILFPTLLANSPRADGIAPARRFIDWTFRNGSIPAVLDETDFDAIVDSGAAFARKLDPVISDGLLRRLRDRTGTGKAFGPP